MLRVHNNFLHKWLIFVAAASNPLNVYNNFLNHFMLRRISLAIVFLLLVQDSFTQSTALR